MSCGPTLAIRARPTSASTACGNRPSNTVCATDGNTGLASAVSAPTVCAGIPARAGSGPGDDANMRKGGPGSLPLGCRMVISETGLASFIASSLNDAKTLCSSPPIASWAGRSTKSGSSTSTSEAAPFAAAPISALATSGATMKSSNAEATAPSPEERRLEAAWPTGVPSSVGIKGIIGSPIAHV